MIQEELEVLEKKYKKREEESLILSAIPDDNYLCIRLDGFKATKTHLKDVIVNDKFTKCLSDAHYQLFCSFRHLLNREYTSSIVCSFMANDEISIVLNKDNNNEDYKRIMKLCTLFAGVLSSAVTPSLNENKSRVSIEAFDARPLILSKYEISEYIRSRYLISKRYAYWKVLRLNNIEGVYDDSIKKNIDNSIRLVKEKNLTLDAEKLITTYKFFLPEESNKPNYKTLNINDKNMALDNLKSKVDGYLSYLHSTKRQN